MILVLGSTGFLGKSVVKKLKEEKKEFYETSFRMDVDLRDFNAVEKLYKSVNPQIIINCASYVGGIQFGLKNEANIFLNNLKMITNIYEVSLNHSISKIINPISNCVYPSQSSFFKVDEIWDGPLHSSVFVYGMVRKMLLVASQAFKSQHGLTTTNLIFSNMYGPGDHFDEFRSHALGALIKKIVEAKKNMSENVIVWGSGKPVREWLYVEDAAEAMVRAVNLEESIEPINVGVGKGISIKDLSELIKNLVGYKGELVFDISKTDGASFKTVDGTSGNKYFNWSPSTNFMEGLRETINWYYSFYS